MRRAVIFAPYDAVDANDVHALGALVRDMHPIDLFELTRLRPNSHLGPLLIDVNEAAATAISAFLIWPAEGGDAPLAFAMATRGAPRMAHLAFFGSRRARRFMPAIIGLLDAMRDEWAAKHGVAVAQTFVLDAYREARRWLASTGAAEGAALPIGREGELYRQATWIFEGAT